jgi:diaminopropionate ammonia-lyase
MSSGFLLNPTARSDSTARGLFSDADYEALRAFSRARPHLAPTPLRRLPALASALGLRDVLLKDESARFGLTAFKVLGVRYALEQLAARKDVRVVTSATTGSHGRALARVSRSLGIRARIYMPAETERERIDAVRSEGAEVVLVDGTYDEAVRQVIDDSAHDGVTIVSDTGWEGYDAIPRAIMLGYTRLMDECADAFDRIAPEVVIVQAGVGGLAGALLSWLAHRFGTRRPFTIVVEPTLAACVTASVAAGAPTTIPGTPSTIMAGLRCAEISLPAWPALRLADACVTIDDDRTIEAMAWLRRSEPEPVSAGPSGACGVAALRAIIEDAALAPLREAAGLNRAPAVFLVNTEAGSESGTPSSQDRTP